MSLPHTWCNVHDIKPKHQDEIEDENADVVAAVIAIEEEQLQYHNLNLNGKLIMNQVTNTQLADKLAAVVHTRNTNGDPLDIIEKHVVEYPRALERIANSMAWRMDTALINAARAILFDLYSADEMETDETAGDHFTRFLNEVYEVVRQPGFWHETSGRESCLEAIELSRVRNDWHTRAQAAAAAADKDYRPISIGDMLVNEKPMKVRVETRANYEVLVSRMAKKRGLEGELLARYVQEKLVDMEKRDDLLANERVKSNKRLIPVVESIIDVIQQRTPEGASFHNLSPKTMRSLTDFAMQTVERVVEKDIATDRKVGTQMFGRILDEQDAALAELKEFRENFCSDAGELENTGTLATS